MTLCPLEQLRDFADQFEGCPVVKSHTVTGKRDVPLAYGQFERGRLANSYGSTIEREQGWAINRSKHPQMVHQIGVRR